MSTLAGIFLPDMSKEGFVHIDQGTRLVKTMLGDEGRRKMLIRGDIDKNAFLSIIAGGLENDPALQVGFLHGVFATITKQETPDPQTKQVRDSAAGVLVDFTHEGIKIPKPVAPFVKSHRETVRDLYIHALKKQTKEKDPARGSIEALLNVGVAVAPYIRQDDMEAVEILKQWRRIENEFKPDERRFISSRVRTVIGKIPKEAIVDSKIRDKRVEQLKRQGLTNEQTGMWLGQATSLVDNSTRRLVAAGVIESSKPTKDPVFDAQVEQFRNEGLSNVAIEERIGRKTRINKATCQLLAEGKIKRLRYTPEQMALFDAQVEFYSNIGFSVNVISALTRRDKSNVIKSVGRCLAKGTLERRHSTPDETALLDIMVDMLKNQNLKTRQIAVLLNKSKTQIDHSFARNNKSKVIE